jgi:RNA polymerase sigma factor (sigma-70 family)
MSLTDHAASLAIRSLVRRPRLTAERERHLLLACRSQDQAIREQAVSELSAGNGTLVVAVACQSRCPDLPLADLVGAGDRGMRAAIEAFDPQRSDARLSAYAVGWIRRAIQDYIDRHAKPGAAYPQLARASARLLADARRACRRDGVEATDAELCARVGARLGLDGDAVAQWLRQKHGTHGAWQAADEDATVRHFDQARLRRCVTALTQEILGERERVVFLARCMTDAVPVRHRDSLAIELGLTRERVFQLEVSARRKMAAALARHGLRGTSCRAPQRVADASV